MNDVPDTAPDFIGSHVTLPGGQVLELKPLTNYRSCHDGMPQEARMVFSATLKDGSPVIVKAKVQLPAEGQEPVKGPSTTTAHEIEALTKFRDAKTDLAPQLIAFFSKIQDAEGPLPGGYVTYTVMTKLPGFGLFGKYWNMPVEERDEIVPKTVAALRAINELGIEPIDRGMRNVIWDPATKHVGIIDFELWEPINGTFANEKNEMQRWGLIRTPPAKDHYIAFNMMYR